MKIITAISNAQIGYSRNQFQEIFGQKNWNETIAFKNTDVINVYTPEEFKQPENDKYCFVELRDSKLINEGQNYFRTVEENIIDFVNRLND